MRAHRAVRVYPPPGNFEKLDCPRQHFVRFEGSLMENKAAKTERKNTNNSGTLLNLKRIFELFFFRNRNCNYVIYSLDNNYGKFLLKILLKKF